jgi:hypothetical protein
MNQNIKQMLDSYDDKTPLIDRLREILQQAALLGLARHNFFEHALFYGGTALRILYGLDRYSEDLDFSLIHPNPQFLFEPYLEAMHQELQIADKKKLDIWSKPIFHDMIQHLQIVNEDSSRSI